MNAVALRPDAVTTTADEAVEQIWSAVLAGTYATVPEAARALWPSFTIDDDDYADLALYGLIQKAKDDQRLTRTVRSSEAQRPAIGYGAPHGKKQWAKYMALTWPYKTADGSARSLLDFTVEDLAAFSERARNIADTYCSQADWADDTRALLAANGVAQVRKLPTDVLERVNLAAGVALGSVVKK